MKWWLVAFALVLLGCAPPDAVPGTAAPEPTPTPTAHPTHPAPASSSPSPDSSAWALGAHRLPMRPDGYGEVRPTPAPLRVRSYPTRDVLPPPPGGRFTSTTGPITPAILRRMGETYAPGCPVPPSQLRYLTVSFRGYDGGAHTGELVVAAEQARGIVWVFRRLFAADFPIEEMRLLGTADVEEPPTGDGNDTAAFICRPSTGEASGFSAHAYGLALDLDPFVNPYVKGDLVLPERAGSYLDRTRRRPGMVSPGDVAVRAFASIGWSWGGDFRSLKDYQHFSATGR